MIIVLNTIKSIKDLISLIYRTEKISSWIKPSTLFQLINHFDSDLYSTFIYQHITVESIVEGDDFVLLYVANYHLDFIHILNRLQIFIFYCTLFFYQFIICILLLLFFKVFIH